MIRKLKKLHQIYKQERYKENVKFLVDPKTGLSPVERERVLNFNKFTVGTANFFGENFYFSHGPSFIHSVDEIFGDEIYKFTSDTEKPFIIDCGANIGISIFYFKKLFPTAEIVAFEPDEHIFNLLKKNTAEFTNLTIHESAVWTEDTILEFFSEGALAGSIITDFSSNNKVTKINAIDLKKHLNRTVDFLKIDIEGAENKLIFDIRNKLHFVKNLFLEYHGIIGDEQNLGEILNLLKEEGFQYYIRLAGETINFPFCKEEPVGFNQQLNIICYRK